MSGYSKFKEKRAVSSVCVEFNADNGSITKFVEVTSDGKISGLSGSPTVSSKIKKLAGGVKIYAAWKSSGGNPYSTLRVSSYGKDSNYNNTTLTGCIRKTIEEDKISQALLKEETEQLDEFKFIGKAFNRIKGMGKNALLWVKNLITKILKAVSDALAKIKKMGEKLLEGLFDFLGIAPNPRINVPNEIQGFVSI